MNPIAGLPVFVCLLGVGGFAANAGAAEASAAAPLAWQRITPLSDREGFAAMFAGTFDGKLFAAGGANFPDKKPWEGGKKIWYDKVFVLEKPDGQWKVAGKLPRPLAYGVSASHFSGIVCVGGSDAGGHRTECFRLAWRGGKMETQPLPPLPFTVANMSGALLGDTLYIAGGIEKPDSTRALRTFLALDLAAKPPVWRELEPWPGPARMLAVAAALDDSFYLVSGAELSPGADGKPVRTYLRDAYRFTPGLGWKRISDLPRAAVAASSPAPTVGNHQFLVIGGDDGSQVNTPPVGHKGFPQSVLAYDITTFTWKSVGDAPFSRATVPTAQWNGAWVVVSGEQRPGVRSPEVWKLKLP